MKSGIIEEYDGRFGVTPYMGVWIEIIFVSIVSTISVVTPYMGVWIEIYLLYKFDMLLLSLPTWECGLKLYNFQQILLMLMSLPTWECGLKSCLKIDHGLSYNVTPYMGVWIEIPPTSLFLLVLVVTPYMGVWIEIPS